MKLGIGTVQFGVDYGVSNKLGITGNSEVQAILELGSRAGIKFIDTSPSYGDSQKKLGVTSVLNQYNIITKLNKFDEDFTASVVNKLVEGIYQSLKELQTESVYGVLIHKPSDVNRSGFSLLFEKLTELKKKGVIKKIGISIYEKSQLEDYLKYGVPDIVQIPLNVLDQRLVNDPLLLELKKKGTEIHIRSVFLQGLLLMEEQEIPTFFGPIKPILHRYFETLKNANMSKLAGALSFVKNLDMVDVLLVGVATAEQLKDNIDAYNNETVINFDSFKIDDPQFLNPSNWVVGK